MRRDDDEELAVCAELPEQGEQQGVVEKVHCVATHDDVESVLKSAFGNVLEPQLSARFSGAGTVAAGECHAGERQARGQSEIEGGGSRFMREGIDAVGFNRRQ